MFGKVIILPVVIYQFGSTITFDSGTITNATLLPVTQSPVANFVADVNLVAAADASALPLPITFAPSASAGGTSNGSRVGFIDPLRLFGFLYGTFPTAPSVFVFATHYAARVPVIATGETK